MAEEKVNETQLFFPFLGMNDSLAYKDQIPLTTSIISNCRTKDVSENRARGGQRAGMVKAIETQIGIDFPILKMVNVVNTYIPPV